MLPSRVRVKGAGSPIDGVFELGPALEKWGVCYKGSDATLLYGENLDEIGGSGYAGWVLKAGEQIVAKCVKMIDGEEISRFSWVLADGESAEISVSPELVQSGEFGVKTSQGFNAQGIFSVLVELSRPAVNLFYFKVKLSDGSLSSLKKIEKGSKLFCVVFSTVCRGESAANVLVGGDCCCSSC